MLKLPPDLFHHQKFGDSERMERRAAEREAEVATWFGAAQAAGGRPMRAA
jgi:hypothetical protein